MKPAVERIRFFHGRMTPEQIDALGDAEGTDVSYAIGDAGLDITVVIDWDEASTGSWPLGLTFGDTPLIEVFYNFDEYSLTMPMALGSVIASEVRAGQPQEYRFGVWLDEELIAAKQLVLWRLHP